MTKIQTLVDKLQDGYRTSSIINHLDKKGIIRSAKHRGAPSKKWATLSFSNLAQQSEKLNAHRA